MAAEDMLGRLLKQEGTVHRDYTATAALAALKAAEGDIDYCCTILLADPSRISDVNDRLRTTRDRMRLTLSEAGEQGDWG